MGSVTASDEEGFDVGEIIFVAVGKRVEQSERALLWAIHHFVGKSICVLHVHRASSRFADEGNEEAVLSKLMEYYKLILTERGVRAFEVCIESDDIEKGIVDVIAWHDVKWLVMGAASDERYNERLAELKSNKAHFVCKEATSSCHIWFICKGHLIYTRGDRQESSVIELTPPLLLTDSPTETNPFGHSSLDSIRRWSYPDIDEDVDDETEEIPSWLFDMCSVNSNSSSNRLVYSPSLSPLLVGKDQKVQEKELHEIHSSVQRWKDDRGIVEAQCKAKAFQSLYVKEISHGKEIEETVERVKQNREKMKDECDAFMKELQMVREENLALESQVTKSQDEIEQWEGKIVSAVPLLVTFKENRDKLRKELENVVKELAGLRNRLTVEEAPSFSMTEFPVFSFVEIIGATNDFDPSWKIAEGRNGTVYRGILRQMQVAIKILPLYGSKSQSDFQRQVGTISRVRHPNLATLIGMCPESESLVYEFLKEGSLEDCLSRKDNTLPWQVRICIATDICSALIFLHSNKPCIVHGNVKPSNILLDANYVSKLGNLGIVSLLPQSNLADSGYTDPEYLKSGELRPEFDVYSFGLVLLCLLTACPIQGLVKDMKRALENDDVNTMLDSSAGDWPLDQATWLVQLALQCCSQNPLDRPDLASDVLSLLELVKTSCSASPSKVSNEIKPTPSHFLCPIVQDIMEDPQIAADGFTYESEAIRGWLDTGHDTSPMTNLKLDHLKLVPNYALLNAIVEWQLLE